MRRLMAALFVAALGLGLAGCIIEEGHGHGWHEHHWH